jgi:REP element-mobilizing transposase RayT
MLATPARTRLGAYLNEYVRTKGLYLRAGYANADHVHVLLDLPTNMTIENLAHDLKGASSHWLNEQRLCPGRFAWQRGYGAFSVSHSMVEQVVRYIERQEEHHRKRSFQEEYRRFVEAYGLQWRDEGTGMVMEDGPVRETVETVGEWGTDETPA